MIQTYILYTIIGLAMAITVVSLFSTLRYVENERKLRNRLITACIAGPIAIFISIFAPPLFDSEIDKSTDIQQELVQEIKELNNQIKTLNKKLDQKQATE